VGTVTAVREPAICEDALERISELEEEFDALLLVRERAASDNGRDIYLRTSRASSAPKISSNAECVDG
jgi:hypothetical protein